MELKKRLQYNSVKDVDKSEGIITLYASSFGVEDYDGDVIENGAFTKTIRERGPQGSNSIKMLWQHDSWNPIGKPLEMVEDTYGLLVRAKVSDIRDGDYLKLYYDGVITEHSIGFRPIKEMYDRDTGVNTIKEVQLWEFSAVTWGANPNTPVVDMKTIEGRSQQLAYLADRMATISKAVRNGNYTEDTFVQLEGELTRMNDMVKSLIEPSKDTRKKDSEPTYQFDQKLFNEFIN